MPNIENTWSFKASVGVANQTSTTTECDDIDRAAGLQESRRQTVFARYRYEVRPSQTLLSYATINNEAAAAQSHPPFWWIPGVIKEGSGMLLCHVSATKRSRRMVTSTAAPRRADYLCYVSAFLQRQSPSLQSRVSCLPVSTLVDPNVTLVTKDRCREFLEITNNKTRPRRN